MSKKLLIFTVLLIMISCKSYYTDSVYSVGNYKQDKRTFIQYKDFIKKENIKYYKVLLKYDKDTIIYGFWNYKSLDSVYLIPYKAYKNCNNNDKLLFFVKDTNEEHHLGKMCLFDEGNTEIVLVAYPKKNQKENNYKFIHYIIDPMDDVVGRHKVEISRYYFYNESEGLFLLRGEERGALNMPNFKYSPSWRCCN